MHRYTITFTNGHENFEVRDIYAHNKQDAIIAAEIIVRDQKNIPANVALLTREAIQTDPSRLAFKVTKDNWALCRVNHARQHKLPVLDHA